MENRQGWGHVFHRGGQAWNLLRCHLRLSETVSLRLLKCSWLQNSSDSSSDPQDYRVGHRYRILLERFGSIFSSLCFLYLSRCLRSWLCWRIWDFSVRRLHRSFAVMKSTATYWNA
jgi:hypothetical protein